MTEDGTSSRAERSSAPRSGRFVRRILLLVVAVAFGPWLSARVLSRSNAVHIETGTGDALDEVRTLPDSVIRLVSWNMAHARGGKLGETNWSDAEVRRQRLRGIGEQIREWDADIVVLNEVDFDTIWSNHEDQASIIANVADYPLIVRQRNYDIVFPFARWRFGNAILSRLPVKKAEFVSFSPKSKIESMFAGNHDSVVITLDIGHGREAKVWAVHLEVRDEATRVQAVQKIVQRCDGRTLVAGDFNSSPTGFKIRNEVDEQNALDVLIKSQRFCFYPSTDPTNAEMTFPSGVPHRCIDWIAAPKTWQQQRGEVMQSGLSDHLPVLTEWQIVDSTITDGRSQ